MKKINFREIYRKAGMLDMKVTMTIETWGKLRKVGAVRLFNDYIKLVKRQDVPYKLRPKSIKTTVIQPINLGGTIKC